MKTKGHIMVTVGKFNKLRVTERAHDGAWVDAAELGELLVENFNLTKEVKAGEEIDVFLYMAGEDNPVVSMKAPLVLPGTAGVLRVAQELPNGVLLDWGMPTLIFVSKYEQKQKMLKDEKHVVYVRLDPETHNLTASAKLDKFLSATPGRLHIEQEVDLIVFDESDLGYRVVINGTGMGMIFKTDVFKKLEIGESTKGYIKNIREDGKVDIYLHKTGLDKLSEIGQQIYDKLKENDGFLPVTDKSPAEEIYNIFGISKKNYKKGVGGLYKKKLVQLDEDGIRLTENTEAE